MKGETFLLDFGSLKQSCVSASALMFLTSEKPLVTRNVSTADSSIPNLMGSPIDSQRVWSALAHLSFDPGSAAEACR